MKLKFQSRRKFLKEASLSALGLYVLPGRSSSYKQTEISVKVDRSVLICKSNFNIGVTHVGNHWEDGNPAAVEKAKKLLANGIKYHNQHLMNWGVGNPEPKPGVYDWTTLDRRVELIRSMSGIPVLTLCSAPGWMNSTGEDVPREISPNHWEDPRVKDEFIHDYADLCRRAALRYPDIKHFQVWNEFKGYWDNEKDNWDYVRFTDFYNTVYDAVKSARADAELGGPYYSWDNDPKPKEWEVVDYWLKNNKGTEFITYDGWVDGYPPTDDRSQEKVKMDRTDFFGKIAAQFRERTGKPVWISEFYGGWSSNPQFTAANHASCYLHSLLNGVAIALLWGPSNQKWNYLFSSTKTEDGGKPSPHYFLVKIFNDHFGAGTEIYKTDSSTGDVEVLASKLKTLLINKLDECVSINLDGHRLQLFPYEFRLLDA